MSIDVPTLLLWEVFPVIMFCREKVSQRYERKLLLSFLLLNMSKFRPPITIILSYLLTHYSGLSLSRTCKGPTNLFEIEIEIEKITVNIEIFTNKTREANKGLLDVSDIKFKCSENYLLKIL